MNEDEIHRRFATMLKNEDRDFKEEELNVHEIAFLLERCFEGIRDPNVEPDIKELYRACIKALREEITYN